MRLALGFLAGSVVLGCAHPTGTDLSLVPVLHRVATDSLHGVHFSVAADRATQVAAYLVVSEGDWWRVRFLGVSDSGVPTLPESLPRESLRVPSSLSWHSFAESTEMWYCSEHNTYLSSQDVNNVTSDCVPAVVTNLQSTYGGRGDGPIWTSVVDWSYVLVVGTSAFQPAARWAGADKAVSASGTWSELQTRLATYLFTAHPEARWGLAIRRYP